MSNLVTFNLGPECFGTSQKCLHKIAITSSLQSQNHLYVCHGGTQLEAINAIAGAWHQMSQLSEYMYKHTCLWTAKYSDYNKPTNMQWWASHLGNFLPLYYIRGWTVVVMYYKIVLVWSHLGVVACMASISSAGGHTCMYESILCMHA